MTSAASKPKTKSNEWPVCRTCPHWSVVRPAADGYQGLGACKRFPPTPMASAGQALPTMGEQDWCGEHPGRAPRTDGGVTQFVARSQPQTIDAFKAVARARKAV